VTEMNGGILRCKHAGRMARRAGRNQGSRKVTIGQHGPLTAEQARKTALRWLGEGSDPATAKSEARKAPTIWDLAERYITEHAVIKKRPGSVQSDQTLLRLHILPRLGSMKVNAIERRDVAQLH
jgi:Phage integrase, N-terminal SAM-like domain